MLLAAISVGVISMATLTATAQPKKTVKIKPLNTKKWEKYDVGSFRFHDKATHTEGSQIYNRLIPKPDEYISSCAR